MTTFADQLQSLKDDPAQMVRLVVQTVKDAEGYDIPSTSNPVVLLLESGACMVAAAMQESAIQTRKQYPLLAQTQEDLYPHMSDKDFLNRFSLPASTTFTLMLNYQEVLNRLVLDVASGVKKIVIPRNTIFYAGDYKFSIQYPIEIKQMRSGALRVTWDTSVVSPLKSLSSNLLEYEVVTPINTTVTTANTYLSISIPTDQFEISTSYLNIDYTGCKIDIPFTNQFYCARAYTQNDDGTYTEIRVTHSDLNYDASVPTLAVRVVGQVLQCNLPTIYVDNGSVPKSKIRIDLYQTLGNINLDLSTYDASVFKAQWYAIDPAERTIFTAPLDTFGSLQEYIVSASGLVSGGRDALSFSDLRQRVMTNSFSSPFIPITPTQISTALQDLGYTVVLRTDNILGRTYLATRSMIDPVDTSLITAASAGCLTLSTTLSDAVTYPGVVGNLNSVTLTPKVLYKASGEQVSLVSKAEIDDINAMPIENRMLVLTNGNYQKSPFYYVLDAANNVFETRAYSLDTPVFMNRTAITENDTTQMQVSVSGVSVSRTDTGYDIVVNTSGDDTYNGIIDSRVFAQLAWKSPGENDYSYILGEITAKTTNNDRQFTFHLKTSLALDSNDYLPIQSQIYTADDRWMPALLEQEFQILFSTIEPAPTTWSTCSIDSILGIFQLPQGAYAIDQESVSIHFGDRLKHLWTRTRSDPKSYVFQTYQEDIPLTYQNDILAGGLDSGLTFDANGNPQFTYLHRKGDPVLDANGNPVYAHKKGDIINGTGVGDVVVQTADGPVPGRSILRRVDITVIDALYWFATDSAATNYRAEMVAAMVDWLTNDFDNVANELLEETVLYFHPSSSLGTIKCLVDDGTTTTLNSEQSWYVKLFVPDATMKNETLKAKIRANTTTIIASEIAKTQYTTSNLIDALKTSYGEDVTNVLVSCTSDMANYSTVTILDDFKHFTIKKKLTNVTTDVIVVEENVVFDFVKHAVTK